MDALVYLKQQIKSMRSLQASVLEDINTEILAKKPVGTTSSIGVIWLHMLISEENFITTITGGETLWESQGWRNRFDLEKYPNIGEEWTGYEEHDYSLEMLQEYTRAVTERTQEVLDSASGGSLEENVKFFTDNDPKSRVWVLLIGHNLIHSGEIAALKGVHGGQGLPF